MSLTQGETIYQWWEKRGINYDAVMHIVDKTKEGSHVCEAAKYLICMLDDAAFNEEEINAGS